jgi:hypothetical protein
MVVRKLHNRYKKVLKIMVVLISALVILSACFNSQSKLSRNTSQGSSKTTNTITVTVGEKTKSYQVKKDTTLLSFAVSQLSAKESKGFITSVGDIHQNAKESVYLMFDINGKKSMVGAGDVKLVNGEKIKFYLEKY